MKSMPQDLSEDGGAAHRRAASDTLAAALPREMVRVARLAEQYRTVDMGHVAAALMDAAIDLAQEAIENADVVSMLRAFAILKGYEA